MVEGTEAEDGEGEKDAQQEGGRVGKELGKEGRDRTGNKGKGGSRSGGAVWV